jgi:hypothetical protein
MKLSSVSAEKILLQKCWVDGLQKGTCKNPDRNWENMVWSLSIKMFKY